MSILEQWFGGEKVKRLEEEKKELQMQLLDFKSENIKLTEQIASYDEGRFNMEKLVEAFALFSLKKSQDDWRDKKNRKVALDYLDKVSKIVDCAVPLIRRSKSDSRYNNALRTKFLKSLSEGQGIPEECKKLWQ